MNDNEFPKNKITGEPYMSPEEKTENARNFRVNAWIFGGGLGGLIVYVSIMKWLGWLSPK